MLQQYRKKHLVSHHFHIKNKMKGGETKIEEIDIVENYPLEESEDDEEIRDKARLIYLLREERDCDVVTYIEQHFREESHRYELGLMLKYPYFANKILDDFSMENEEKENI